MCASVCLCEDWFLFGLKLVKPLLLHTDFLLRYRCRTFLVCKVYVNNLKQWVCDKCHHTYADTWASSTAFSFSILRPPFSFYSNGDDRDSRKHSPRSFHYTTMCCIWITLRHVKMAECRPHSHLLLILIITSWSNWICPCMERIYIISASSDSAEWMYNCFDGMC